MNGCHEGCGPWSDHGPFNGRQLKSVEETLLNLPSHCEMNEMNPDVDRSQLKGSRKRGQGDTGKDGQLTHM
jgi:hypothetical protein